jgi:hypothetical protein
MKLCIQACADLTLNQLCKPWPSLERETGIEPVSLAWKAKVLPLNYSRLVAANTASATGILTKFIDRLRQSFAVVEEAGFEPAYAMRADLQSAAFNHSATPPQRA